MRVPIACALLVISAATFATAQRLGKQNQDLRGPVKVVRLTIVFFDCPNGECAELPSKEPERSVQVFDREGTLLLSEVLTSLPWCGFRPGGADLDPARRSYDSNGNLIEYLPMDTLEHSSYRLKHFYDSKGRLMETEHYDPYTLRYKLIYTYGKDDQYGNWTTRTVTPIIVNTTSDKLTKSEQHRIIQYY